jgi:hypothetical protein
MPYADSTGAKIYYEEEGSGPPLGGVLNVEIRRSRSVITPCFNGSKTSELRHHLHFQNTTHWLCLKPSQNRTSGFPTSGSSFNHSAWQKD